MARKSWRPYKIVSGGVSIDVSADEFAAALKDGHIIRCERDRRKAYVRADLKMYRDRQTKQTRFALRTPPEHDPDAIPSSWYLIERAALYLVEPVRRP